MVCGNTIPNLIYHPYSTPHDWECKVMMEQNTVDYKTIANMTARQRLLRVFGKKGYISWKLSQFVGCRISKADSTWNQTKEKPGEHQVTKWFHTQSVKCSKEET